MGTYDFFVGRLLCPICGAVSAPNVETGMQTKVRDKPGMENLRLGDVVSLRAHVVATEGINGYTLVRPPTEGEPIRILQRWECPTCGAGYNWAEVVIHMDVLVSIENVPFDRAHFERSHLVRDDAIDIVMQRTGKTYSELVRADLAELLREYL